MTDTLDVETLGARAETMIEALAAISAEPHRLVRLYLSSEHRRAADLVARWMGELGLEVSEDALGTVRGRWRGRQEGTPGANATQRLLIGSHIDTVIDAGKYDGPFGVIAGLVAVEHLRRMGRRYAFGVDVLAFGDEEGSRFPSTLSSSAGVAGIFDPATLTLTDRDGITFAQALTNYGKDTADIAATAYAREEAAAYVELHIEQGPVLEHENEPLGVVTAIVGQTRARISVTGEAGHAGTVPMGLRKDALAGAVEMISFIETLARRDDHASDRMVATVGMISAEPGAVNIIPARVVLSLDLRCQTDAVREAALAEIDGKVADIAARRGLGATLSRFHDIPTTPCAPALQANLANAVAASGGRPVYLPSGAGHDGMSMAKLCPSAMLFVRCKDGISHNPAEFTSRRDMGIAIAALIRFIDSFDPAAL
jgi:allantoate deiminase